MNSLSKLALVLTFCTGMIACSGGKAVKGDYGVVPLLQEVTLTNGNPFRPKSIHEDILSGGQ